MASLMSLPLEVRYSIFEHLSARKSKPRKLLRYWFEKAEVKCLIQSYKSHDPNRPAPLVLYNDDDCDTERESVINENYEENADGERGDKHGEQKEQGNEGNDNEDEDADGPDDDQEGDSDNETLTTRENSNVAQLFSRLTIRPNRRWRHIPHMLRLTHCPPPAELFLTSRQLNTEARNWYYDMATLRINATGSFAHTIFWQEAMMMLFTTSEFSPLENIQKAEVTFVWDTTWIRRDTTGGSQALLSALLRQRGKVVYQALTMARELREVVIRWHNSAQDNEATNLKKDVLGPFNALSATVKIEEHYIAPDAEPKKRTVASKRRLEFENIYHMGLDHPF